MKDNYVIINRFPKNQKYEDPQVYVPEKGMEHEVHFEEGFLPGAPTNQVIIGVINSSKLENISWSRGEEVEIGPGQLSANYTLNITYLGSSAQSDGALIIQNLGSNIQFGFEDPVANKFPTKKLQVQQMNHIVGGICKAIMQTYESNGNSVVNYYPPFDLGNISLTSTVDPYGPGAGEEEKGDFEVEEAIMEELMG